MIRNAFYFRYYFLLISLLIGYFPIAYAAAEPSMVNEAIVSDTQHEYHLQDYPSSQFATQNDMCAFGLRKYKSSSGRVCDRHWSAVYLGSEYSGICYYTNAFFEVCQGFYEGTDNCPSGSIWNGTDCVSLTYSCPTSGTWTLSADQQTCTGCYDPSQILDADNVCVSAEDKDLGESSCEETVNVPGAGS